MISIVVFFLIALVPSVIGAISGIGGGIIIKPVLDMAAGSSLAGTILGDAVLGAREINFLSGCTVLSMSAVSLLRSRKNGVRLEGSRGLALAAGAVIGGIAGRMIFSLAVRAIHRNLIGTIQSSILIIMTVCVIVYILKKNTLTGKNLQFLPLCALMGLGLGLVSAFLGIGGGPINIMVISFFLSMDTKTSALHSLFVIFLSQLASLLITIGEGIPPVPVAGLLAMIPGGIAGALIGSAIVKLLRNDQVDRLFNILMMVVIALSVYNLVNFIKGGFV